MGTSLLNVTSLEVSEDITLPAYAGFIVVLLNPHSGSITVTLPDAADAGGYMMIKTSASYSVTLATTDSQTINGESTFTALSDVGNGYVLWSDGSNWKMRNPTLIHYT